MKKSLLLAGAVIFLLGMIQKFDGQEKTQSRRQWPGGGKAVIEQQSKRAHTAFFSRQEPDRWTIDQTLPYQHPMTTSMAYQDYIAHATMTGNTLAQHELSAGVDTAWVRHYASKLVGSKDVATAITVDDSGNVYVTGFCIRFPSGYDYLTVKYSSSGSQLWVTSYNGPANAWDEATALAVDAFGNVYVTGRSRGSDTRSDYATIKYNSEGVEQWVARYNGSGDSWDEANALVVDASGNVYVTGGSEGDYATVKYNSEGVEQWVARYNGPGNSGDGAASAMAVDASGNVFVAGRSESDYATVRYNSEGIEQWAARYNGPGNSNDRVNALAVDASGNVYVTGVSAPSGGNPYSGDYATVKYNSEGVEQWVARYENAEGQASALAADATGNVYVTGWSRGLTSNRDYATIKYNSEGIELWIARYNGAGDDYPDEAYALAVDASGNIYVTGASWHRSTKFDYATVKYTSEGIEQWVARYTGPEDSWARAYALAVDSSGNVYVTGGSESDYATVKYTSEGIEQWAVRYNGGYSSQDHTSALAIDVSGNV